MLADTKGMSQSHLGSSLSFDALDDISSSSLTWLCGSRIARRETAAKGTGDTRWSRSTASCEKVVELTRRAGLAAALAG